MGTAGIDGALRLAAELRGNEAAHAIQLDMLRRIPALARHQRGRVASEGEIAQIILGIDPVVEPERARRELDSRLGRARGMTEVGYR